MPRPPNAPDTSRVLVMLSRDRAAKYLDVCDIRGGWIGWGIEERRVIRRRTVHLAPGVTKVVRRDQPVPGHFGRVEIDDGERDRCREAFHRPEFDPFQPFEADPSFEIASDAEHTVGLVEQWRPREGTDAYRRWLWRATVDSAIRELQRDGNARYANSNSHRLDLSAMQPADRGRLLRGDVVHLTFDAFAACAEQKAAPDIALARAFGLGASSAERTAHLYRDWHILSSALRPVNVPAAAGAVEETAEREAA